MWTLCAANWKKKSAWSARSSGRRSGIDCTSCRFSTASSMANANDPPRPIDAFEARPQLSWEEMNAEFVHELRWWTLDEIAASDAVSCPPTCTRLLVTLLRDGPPPDSVDVST